jgi:peptidoglycan/xylan/chitin deacetylase (PgdA/CDA1 family)
MVKTLAGALALVFCATLLAAAKGNTLNAAYLVPGGSVKLDRQAIAAHKFCALTFDDGPDATYTPQVAKVLARYNVPATFFVVGQRVSSRPDTVLALHSAGHEIANHSWSHPDFTKLSAAERKSQITRTTAALEKIGITPRWFRPPYGAFDKSVVKSSQGCGLKPVLWSVDPLDWAQPGVQKIENRVLNGSGNGAVILLHSTNPQTVAALPGIIEKLSARGYTFVTMSQWEQAAMGRPYQQQAPAPLVSPNGEPPSFRELEGLPEAPPLPGAGPGLLASTEGPLESDQAAANPEWVQALAPDFQSPVEPELVAEPAPAVEAETEAAPAEPEVAKAKLPVDSGVPLFIFGNFTQPADAERIFGGGAGQKLQRR